MPFKKYRGCDNHPLPGLKFVYSFITFSPVFIYSSCFILIGFDFLNKSIHAYAFFSSINVYESLHFPYSNLRNYLLGHVLPSWPLSRGHRSRAIVDLIITPFIRHTDSLLWPWLSYLPSPESSEDDVVKYQQQDRWNRSVRCIHNEVFIQWCIPPPSAADISSLSAGLRQWWVDYPSSLASNSFDIRGVSRYIIYTSYTCWIATTRAARWLSQGTTKVTSSVSQYLSVTSLSGRKGLHWRRLACYSVV